MRETRNGARTRWNLRPLGGSLLAASALTLNMLGCASDSGTESSTAAEERPGVVLDNESALNLVAELDLGPNRRIKYFEPEPGSVMEVEYGRADPDREPEPEDSIVARYERLSGNKAPDGLAQAVQRADVRRAVARLTGPEPALQEGTPVGAPHSYDKGQAQPSPASEDWFFNAYCKTTDHFWGTGDWNFWWQGDSSFSKECEYFKTGIWTAEGGVSIDVRCTGRGIQRGDWATGTVEAGYYVGVRCDTVTNRVHSSQVFNAAGDRYRHCINWHQ